MELGLINNLHRPRDRRQSQHAHQHISPISVKYLSGRRARSILKPPPAVSPILPPLEEPATTATTLMNTMSSLYTPNISPSASGRNTPLGHFRDFVSAIRKTAVFECSYLYDVACKAVQAVANNMLIRVSTSNKLLTGISPQMHDAASRFRSEDDSEAHQVRARSFSCRVACRSRFYPRCRFSVNRLATSLEATSRRR